MQITSLSGRRFTGAEERPGAPIPTSWVGPTPSQSHVEVCSQSSSAFVQIPYCLPFLEDRAVLRQHAEFTVARVYGVYEYTEATAPRTVLLLFLYLFSASQDRSHHTRLKGTELGC